MRISSNELNSWKTIYLPLRINNYRTNLFYNNLKSIVYPAEECNTAKLVISEDAGGSWKAEDININAPLSSDLFVTKSEDVLNISCSDGFNEIKLNNEAKWSSFLINNKFTPLQILTLKSGKLIAVCKSSIFISIDNGKMLDSMILVDKLDDRYTTFGTEVIALTNNRICTAGTLLDKKTSTNIVNLFFSSDYGKTFTIKKVEGINREVNIFSLQLTKEGYFLLLLSDDIYLSKDEGDIWVSIKGNLDIPESTYFNNLIISPNDYLYVGTYSNGIYKSRQSLQKILNAKENLAFDSFDFNLYPNPVTDELNVQVSGFQENVSNVSIYSIEGKLLSQTQFYGNASSLLVQQLPKGMYLLQLRNGEKSGVKRFVKY